MSGSHILFINQIIKTSPRVGVTAWTTLTNRHCWLFSVKVMGTEPCVSTVLEMFCSRGLNAVSNSLSDISLHRSSAAWNPIQLVRIHEVNSVFLSCLAFSNMRKEEKSAPTVTKQWVFILPFGVQGCTFWWGLEGDVSCFLREQVCLWVHFCCRQASPCTAAQACPRDSLGGRSLSSQSVLPRAINY